MVFYDLLKTPETLNCNYTIIVAILYAARIIPTHLYNILTYYTSAILLSSRVSPIVWDFDVLYK